MKLASVFLRGGKYFVQAQSQTTAGVWIGNAAVDVVEEPKVDELVEKVLDALNRSRQGVPHPSQSDWKEIQKPILVAAGVKSWTTFAKGSKLVGLAVDGSMLTMEPHSNYDQHGGTVVAEKMVRCDVMDQDLGKYLLRTFQACD